MHRDLHSTTRGGIGTIYAELARACATLRCLDDQHAGKYPAYQAEFGLAEREFGYGARKRCAATMRICSVMAQPSAAAMWMRCSHPGRSRLVNGNTLAGLSQ